MTIPWTSTLDDLRPDPDPDPSSAGPPTAPVIRSDPPRLDSMGPDRTVHDKTPTRVAQ